VLRVRPASGSIEGMIYARAPMRNQPRGSQEVVPPALLLSALLCDWVNHSEKRWLNWGLGVVFFLLLALPRSGLAEPQRMRTTTTIRDSIEEPARIPGKMPEGRTVRAGL